MPFHMYYMQTFIHLYIQYVLFTFGFLFEFVFILSSKCKQQIGNGSGKHSVFSHKIGSSGSIIKYINNFFSSDWMDKCITVSEGDRERSAVVTGNNRNSFSPPSSCLPVSFTNGTHLMAWFHIKWNINWWILMVMAGDLCNRYQMHLLILQQILQIWTWTLMGSNQNVVCYAQNNFQQLSIKNISIIQSEICIAFDT